MRFLVIEHEPDCPPGLLGQQWQAAGVELQVCRPYRGEPVPQDAAGAAALVVLGGRMNCQQDDVAPWLPDTRALLRRVVADGTPTLGVCLGHQLLAVALGGSVAANPAGPTVGVHHLDLLEAAQGDPLVGGFDERQVTHWNGDVVTEPPAGAQVLARQPDGSPQAIRFAPTAWGVQFHPEATPSIVEAWAYTEPISPKSREYGPAAVAQVRAAQDDLAAFAGAFSAAFLAQVADGATP